MSATNYSLEQSVLFSTEMSNTCATCNISINRRSKNIEIIECALFCGRVFHKNCVGISDSDFTSLLNQNFFWKCNSCANLNSSSPPRKTAKKLRIK